MYRSHSRHQGDLHVTLADGSGADEALTDDTAHRAPMSWSSDGRWIISWDREPAGNRRLGLAAIPVDRSSKPVLVVPRQADIIAGASLSPDQRWLAFDTDHAGRREVWVVSFPDGETRIQVSAAGGQAPIWTRGGRELVYVAPDRQVMSVSIDTTVGLRAATPVPMFTAPDAALDQWDVLGDGERFLFAVPVLASSSVPLTLVQNWTAGLKQ